MTFKTGVAAEAFEIPEIRLFAVPKISPFMRPF